MTSKSARPTDASAEGDVGSVGSDERPLLAPRRVWLPGQERIACDEQQWEHLPEYEVE